MRIIFAAISVLKRGQRYENLARKTKIKKVK